MHRYILFIFCFCNLHAQVSIEPLYEKHYRPGHWWPVRITSSEDFLQKCKMSINNFHWRFSQNTNYIGYSLIDNKLVDSKVHQNGKILANTKTSLAKLRSTDFLVGIYTKNPVATPPTNAIFFTNLTWIPDSWQGLSSLNAIFINTNVPIQHRDVLQKWIRVGGTVYTLAKYVPSFALQPNYIEKKIEYGQGYIQIFPKISPQIIINFIQKKSKKPLLNQLNQVIPPAQRITWTQYFQWRLIGVCLLHILIIISVHIFIKNMNKRIIVMFILTLFVISSLILWLKQYDKVAHNKYFFYRHVSEKNTVIKNNIHHFTSLETQKWQYRFSHLPLPKHVQKDFYFFRESDIWGIEIPIFHRDKQLIYETSSLITSIGSALLTVENNNIIFRNGTEFLWKNIYWKNSKNMFYLGKCDVGETINWEKNTQTNFKNENIYLKWLKHNISQNTLYSFSNETEGIFAVHYIQKNNGAKKY